MVLLLAAICTISILGGCGKTDGNKSDKKDDSTSASSERIKYDASDYVKLGDYKGLKVALESSYEVKDEDIKTNIESFLESYPAYEDSDKETVESGDMVNIDYEGLKDGTAFEGGTATDHVLEIGSHSFIKGFEEGLIGAKVGDKVALDLTFPEDYENTELAGQAVVFNVTVNKIVNRVDMTYDMLTDEYVAANFTSQGFKNVDEFKAGIKSQLETSNASKKESDTQNAVITKLKEACTVESLPKGLLEQRVAEYKKGMLETLKKNYDMELAEYLDTIGTTEEEFDKQNESYMKENLETELVLQAIAKKEKMKVDDKEFEKYVAGVVSDFGYESEDALIKQFGEDYVKNIFITDKVLSMVTEKAVITYGSDKGDAAK